MSDEIKNKMSEEEVAKMKEMDEKEVILGFKGKDVRKYFFEKKVNDLVDKIQGKGVPDDESIKNLESYLIYLSLEREWLTPLGDTVKPYTELEDEMPSIGTLNDRMSSVFGTEQDYKKFLENKEKVNVFVSGIKKMMKNCRLSAKKNQSIPKNIWSNYAQEIFGILHHIQDMKIKMEMVYREEITWIIDNYNCSRKEAEERAKCTEKYFQYKRMSKFVDQIEEFLLVCKKHYGDGGY